MEILLDTTSCFLKIYRFIYTYIDEIVLLHGLNPWWGKDGFYILCV